MPTYLTMRFLPLVLAFALVSGACGGQSTTTTDAAPAVSTSAGDVTTLPESPPPPSSTSTATAPPAPTTTTEPPEFALFLTSLESALTGTRYADEVFNEADVFVAIGQLMCERLDGGETVDEVLARLVGALDEDEATPEETVAIGVVFGVAIEVLCPTHAGVLE